MGEVVNLTAEGGISANSNYNHIILDGGAVQLDPKYFAEVSFYA